MKFTIGALAAFLVAVSAIPTSDINAREAHEVHHHHYHADGTEMTAAQVEHMKRATENEYLSIDTIQWKEGARFGPALNGHFYCMGPHGWVNMCGP